MAVAHSVAQGNALLSATKPKNSCC